MAFVIGAADPDAVIERCRAELAGFKVPRRMIALEAFPTTPSANGERVQRAELRRMAQFPANSARVSEASLERLHKGETS